MKTALLTLSIAGILAFSACGPSADHAKQAPDQRLNFSIKTGEWVGLITRDQCTRGAVLNNYRDSARVDYIATSGGRTAEGVVVFPNDPRNRLEVYWDEALDPSYPLFMRIRSNGDTDWKTLDGITTGLTLSEVENINGAPFPISGFGHEGLARVTSWQNGALSPQLVLEFSLPAGTNLDQQQVLSNNPELPGNQMTVTMMELSFPRTNLVPLLQGWWQSDTDPDYKIEFSGDHLHHYQKGALVADMQIEADPTCKVVACTVAGATPKGFCFLERDDKGGHCNFVVLFDGQRLVYAPIGSASAELSFSRVSRRK